MPSPGTVRNKRRWWKAASRLRHSRGFGIHSPFAYDLLMNTLRERSPYYLYHQIEELSPALHDTLKLLVRLVCRLRPGSFCAVGSIAPVAGRIVLLADSAIEIDSATPEMLFVGRGVHDVARQAVDCVERGGTLFVADADESRDVVAAVTENMGRGMTFSNGREFIAVGRADLPRQHFELNF